VAKVKIPILKLVLSITDHARRLTFRNDFAVWTLVLAIYESAEVFSATRWPKRFRLRPS